tara:strand:+ start:12293 stop:13414 length:1122 start_codon:yes stop_codon:yes gene_type:complete
MKNKIFKYDFLIVGGGLVGSLAAIALFKKKYKVLLVEKNNSFPNDQRTLAVNANSRDFLKSLGIWQELEIEQEPINEIIIKDYVNKDNLIFQNEGESMGSVIFNKSLLKISRDYLKKNNILLSGINFNLLNFESLQKISIRQKDYFFKKIIISTGKNNQNSKIIKKNTFSSMHNAYVGFFNHKKNHHQKAYEIFTPQGPLAVLPSPSDQKKSSTFIFSTKNKMTYNSLLKILNNFFYYSHGKINLRSSISFFPISPHLSQSIQKNILLIGDTAHSIHPVAGQGWNLGIKDIQELCKCLDNYSLDDINFDKIYSSKRIIENMSYLKFTNLINFLYESKIPLASTFIKISFHVLNRFSYLRKLFIKQAMGKVNLI